MAITTKPVQRLRQYPDLGGKVHTDVARAIRTVHELGYDAQDAITTFLEQHKGGAVGVATVAAGAVTAVTVYSNGWYRAKPIVKLSGGGGTGAVAVAVMDGTRVKAVTVTQPGAGYASAPTVSFIFQGVDKVAAI